MVSPGWFKKVKDFTKKVYNKAKPVVKKIAKIGNQVLEKLKPAVDVITDFVPYGDVVDKVYDGVQTGFKYADKFVNGNESKAGVNNNIKTNNLIASRPKGIDRFRPSGFGPKSN